MQISHTVVLNKIEQKIKEARAAGAHEAKVREQLQAVKTLCELVLEDTMPMGGEVAAPISVSIPQRVEPILSNPTVQTVSNLGAKKLETEDGANGDSIFDF